MRHEQRGYHRGVSLTARSVGLDRAVRWDFLLPAALVAATTAVTTAAVAAPTIATAGAMASGAGLAGAVSGLSSLSGLAAFLPSLKALGVASSLLGTGVSTLASINQASTTSAMLKANSKASELEAQSIKDQSAFEEKQFRREAELFLGKQQAVGAASGIEITSGSSLFAELDNIRQIELEALNLRRGGQLAASSKRFESQLSTMQAQRISNFSPGIYLGGVAQAGSVLSQLLR